MQGNERLFANSVAFALDHFHEFGLSLDLLEHQFGEGIQPGELADIEAGDGLGDLVGRVEQADQSLDDSEVVGLGLLEVLFPELFGVT